MTGFTEEFNRESLSVRENEILNSAIDGMTDIQISLKLGITQSTVNSYWVRIRGKLGQLSRTELVALALKQQSREELAVVLAQSKVFEQRAVARDLERRDDDNAELFSAILGALPEALLAFDIQGKILFANERLERMFQYEPGMLVGQSVGMLFPDICSELYAMREGNEGVTAQRHIGLHEPFYARRKEGSEFRTMLLLQASSLKTGVTSCLVRDFINEIDVRRRWRGAGLQVGELR
jgi:PAS domain S-box-containing protein